jgi:predicted metalloendopeptidase
MLHDNDWMGEETRQLAIEKAKAMLPLVGYPALIDNDTALDEEYANVGCDAGSEGWSS